MELTEAQELLDRVLRPLEFVVWGEVAMGRLGVPVVAHVSRRKMCSVILTILRLKLTYHIEYHADTVR